MPRTLCMANLKSEKFIYVIYKSPLFLFPEFIYFLTNFMFIFSHQQYVSISGIYSNILNLTCGVPQGSSLEPLLFLIYINDFRKCLNECSAGHFADASQ